MFREWIHSSEMQNDALMHREGLKGELKAKKKSPKIKTDL